MAQKKDKGGDLALIGLGVAALLGAYLFYGKDGQKRRKKITGWMLKAKGDVLAKVEKMKDVSEEKYAEVVGQVVEKYAKMKEVDTRELEVLAKDLKAHWKNIKRELEASTKTAKKGKSAVKKTAQRVKKVATKNKK